MKFFIAILIGLTVLGCKMDYENFADRYYAKLAGHHRIYHGDFSAIQSLEEISVWVKTRVKY